MLHSVTLASNQEARGLIQESFLGATLVPRRGPDTCSISSTQAQMLSSPSPRSRPDLCHCVPAGALQIESSEESDQGKYECVATNSKGTRYSAPANLYVRGKDAGRAQPCLCGAELTLLGMLSGALGVDGGGCRGPSLSSSHLFLPQQEQPPLLPRGRLPMSAATFPSFPAGPLGGSRSGEHLYLL